MKKVFIIHGFEGSPNGGWRPWLMAELEKLDIYACALSMPHPEAPQCNSWVAEIDRHVTKDDEIYLAGHSLGVPAILRYLTSSNAQAISGAVLVSGPAKNNDNPQIASFFESPFDFAQARIRCNSFVIIHGEDDPLVPLADAHILADELQGELEVVPQGGHLNGSVGWLQLPVCLQHLKKMLS
ncbi:MAG: alpha/beta hydrolase [bacterium]